jgi:hypothetical protein
LSKITVVDKRVLAREGEAAGANTLLLEDRPLVVVTRKSRINLGKTFFVEDVAANKVTELEKCAKSAEHLSRDIALDRRKIDLYKHCECEKQTR